MTAAVGTRVAGAVGLAKEVAIFALGAVQARSAVVLASETARIADSTLAGLVVLEGRNASGAVGAVAVSPGHALVAAHLPLDALVVEQVVVVVALRGHNRVGLRVIVGPLAPQPADAQRRAAGALEHTAIACPGVGVLAGVARYLPVHDGIGLAPF